jgi:hypothetical protein
MGGCRGIRVGLERSGKRRSLLQSAVEREETRMRGRWAAYGAAALRLLRKSA